MEEIDSNTNRLPRGRTYANNGSVKEIKIENATVRAKVKGRLPSPYSIKISLKQFNKSQIEEIKNLVNGNPVIAAELSLGKLPESLLVHLEERNLMLFPKSWKDLNSNCSCPDDANPCKHIAAVYYLISSEVDKDPFFLFNMKGIATNVLTGLRIKNEASQKLKNVKHFFTTASKIKKMENPEQFDLSLNIPERDIDSIFSLLPGSPLFYDKGDFRKILLKACKVGAKNAEILALEEEFPDLRDVELRLIFSDEAVPSIKVFVSNDKIFSSIARKFRPKKISMKVPSFSGKKLVFHNSKGVIFELSEFLEFFQSHPVQTDLQNSSPTIRFFSLLSGLSLSFVRSNSFFPELVEIGDDDFFIRYVPGIHDERIVKLLLRLEDFFPREIGFNPITQNILTPSSITELAAFFISETFRSLLKNEPGLSEDKILFSFFGTSSLYIPDKFNEQNIGKGISNWLERLSTLNSNINPVIKIEPSDKIFQLNIEVENRNSIMDAMISLSDIFGSRKEFFGTSVEAIRSRLSRQIALAGEFIPELKDVLSSRGLTPSKIDLKRIGKFLTDYARILEILNIKFILPKSLKNLLKPEISLLAKAKKFGNVVKYLDLNEILQFSWQVTLGEHTISRKEFINLCKNADGLVEFRGQYILLDPDEAKKILEKIEKPLKEMSPMDVIRSGLTGEAEGVKFQSDEYLKNILSELNKTEYAKVPSGLNAKMRPYQVRGFQWMLSNLKKGFGSCLADDMGLGKTLQTIALILKLKEERKLLHPALIVCPTTLVGNWQKEFQKFAPTIRTFIYYALSRTLELKNNDVIITTYGLLRRDLKYFQKKTWGLFVIDEAQYIKNHHTDQTKAIKSLNADNYLALSGTPVENRLLELWSIFDFINNGYLGDHPDFKKTFSVPVERYRDPEKIEKVRLLTSPFLMRRLKTDKTIINDLPDKIVSDEYCQLTKEQAILYERIVQDVMSKIESQTGMNRRGSIFQLMTFLKQICNHPVHFAKKGKPKPEISGKALTTLAILDKIIGNREKVLIFSQYTEMGKILCEMIQDALGETALFFHGGLSRKNRDAMVDDFQNRSDCKILILSLKAGGVGLNLTTASNVIHYDLWWNPAVESQATDRAYRIGQAKNVSVHRLITMKTFEEKIDAMIKSKKELADLTVATGETWITELSNKELKSMFSLSD